MVTIGVAAFALVLVPVAVALALAHRTSAAQMTLAAATMLGVVAVISGVVGQERYADCRASGYADAGGGGSVGGCGSWPEALGVHDPFR